MKSIFAYLFLILFLFYLTSAAYADPIKIYEIYNASNFEFVSKPGETRIQCQKFNAIPANQKIDKVIDFDDAKEIDCTAIIKGQERCGMHILLIPRSLLKIATFGDCPINVRPQKWTQVIDKLYIFG